MPSRKQNIAHRINQFLARFGLQLSRYSDLSLHGAFDRLSLRPVPVNTVIDIGASDGRWSERIYRYYPDAFYLLIDANPVYQQALEHFKQHIAKSDYVLAAAGNEEGRTHFYVGDALGGVVYEGGDGFDVPMTSVDVQVEQRALQPPFLVKLDTHGFEVPILEGATKTLEQTNMVILETYNFQITPTSLRFHQMCAHMENLGFRPIDVIEPMHRAHDGAFWQFDLLFIRADRPEFQTNLFV